MPRNDPRPAAESPTTQIPSRRRWPVPVLIVLSTVALVAGAFAVHSASTSSGGEGTAAGDGEPAAVVVEAPSEVAAPDLSSEESRDPADLLAEGPVDAPVALVVFTDYQCPFCAQWTHETAPVMREYVERGELRIEWRDVNVYGEDSERAARAALAAAMQGEHEEYQQRLFEGGEIRSSADLSEEALVDLAGELGLDTDRFQEDLNSEEVASTVAANAQQGIELGAMSTPAFIVGGTPTMGAQPTEVFVDMVDEALAEEG